MKFAQCNYNRFDEPRLGLKLKAGDIFVVDSRIESSPSFQEGLNTRNFVFITPYPEQLGRIIGMTDDMKREFMASIEEQTPEPVPEPEPIEEVPEPQPEPEIEEKTEEPETEELPTEGDTPDDNNIDVDSLTYKELQTYAKDLEGRFGVEINRSAKKGALLKEVKAVLKEHDGE
jgi:hypothetical protein